MADEKNLNSDEKKNFGGDRRNSKFRANKFRGEKNGRKSNFGHNKKADETKSKDRIAKRLAMLGVASRRDAEKLVLDGNVKINGVECRELYQLVSYDDKISVNGKEIVNKPIRTKIYIMNKLSGYVTTNKDPQGRRTIFELIPSKFGRLMAIGRLDYNTEGLLLLTNNGELARIMEMPATGLKRIYYARVLGEINEKVKEQLSNLRKGIKIEGVEYGKMIVEIEDCSQTRATLKIVIFEGKNNEIRRVMRNLGLKVVELTRVQYGEFRLNVLPAGCVQESHIRVDIRDLERQASRNIQKYNQRKAIAEGSEETKHDNKTEKKNSKKVELDDKANTEKPINDSESTSDVENVDGKDINSDAVVLAEKPEDQSNVELEDKKEENNTNSAEIDDKQVESK